MGQRNARQMSSRKPRLTQVMEHQFNGHQLREERTIDCNKKGGAQQENSKIKVQRTQKVEKQLLETLEKGLREDDRFGEVNQRETEVSSSDKRAYRRSTNTRPSSCAPSFICVLSKSTREPNSSKRVENNLKINKRLPCRATCRPRTLTHLFSFLGSRLF